MDEWMRCMREGDFAGAWQVSDRVTRARAGSRADHLPRHQQWIWDGSPIAGRRVLVRCYHGLGDTIQFVRFMRPLRDVARRVTVWCQSELLPLVERAVRLASALDRPVASVEEATDLLCLQSR